MKTFWKRLGWRRAEWPFGHVMSRREEILWCLLILTVVLFLLAKP